MDDVAASAARGAARALQSEFGDQLVGDVEAILHAREDAPAPDQYFVDPVSLAGLIVSVASFAWTIYRDVKATGGAPTRDVIERRVRIEVRGGEISAPPAQRDHIIEVVVAEIIDSAEQ